MANMRERARLHRAMVGFAEAGDREGLVAADLEVGRLIMSGNEVGQRFGLRVCTSTGPDRTPVPH
jgi:hypothetical protein